MNGVARFLRLQAQVRTGLSSAVLAFAAPGIVFGALAFVFGLLSAFVWLGKRFGFLTAAMAIAAVFLLIAIIAVAGCLLSRNAIRRQAALQLAEGKRTMALHPSFLDAAVRVGRTIPWRWIAPALTAMALASGVGIQMFGRHEPRIEKAKEKLQQVEDRLQRAEDELNREYAKTAA